jgi:hypothetical protein
VEGLAPSPSLVARVAVVVEGVLMPATYTYVDDIPECDFHPGKPAYADAKTRSGPWAYVCRGCFTTHQCSLGTGRGQELLLRPMVATPSEVPGERPKVPRETEEEHEFQEGWDSV